MPGVELRAGRAPCVLSRDARRLEHWKRIVGGLEGGSSVSFASGMAGIAAIFDQLHTGSVVALSDDCYQLSRESPKLAKAAADGPCIASPWRRPRAGSRCVAGRLGLAGVAFEPAANRG